VILAFLVLGGPSLGRYQVTLVTTLLLYIAATTGWNLIGGVAGQFSLATSAFIGAGSYTTIMLLRGTGWPLWLTLAAAGALGGLFAALTGLVLFRLRGFYFTIGTLAVALAALTWMTTFAFTGATTGISAPLSLIPDTRTLYLIAVVLAGIAIAVSIAMIHSPLGLRLMAVRDDEEVAASLGVSPFRSKMSTMTVSGVIIGIVGGVLAIQKASIEPFSAFSLDWSITIVVMAIVGGIGTLWGPTIGAVLIYYGITVQLQAYPALSSILSGLLLVTVIMFLPSGIVGGTRKLIRRLATRARQHPGAGQKDVPAFVPPPLETAGANEKNLGNSSEQSASLPS
ncbi:MAG: branched-chain amino acid ABC transporter permease, partial [Actinomycetota bacterium]|nr:branched-chain amino acid ABC transporter permease [Actinomycetota bacterium]